MKQWIFGRVVQPIVTLMQQGVDPHRITLSVAFGLGLGIFPVPGLPTLMCTLAALIGRLNLPAVQLVNYLTAPLQLALIIPFVRLGERLVGMPPQPVSIPVSMQLIADGPYHAVVGLWIAICHGMLGWLVVVPALTALVLGVSRPLMQVAADTREQRVYAVNAS